MCVLLELALCVSGLALVSWGWAVHANLRCCTAADPALVESSGS